MFRGAYDLLPFLITTLITLLFFTSTLHVMGAQMDDGGNFEDDYDTMHNDYAYSSYFSVNALSAIRTAIGDVQPPTYDYWVNNYYDFSPEYSKFCMNVIWFLFCI